MQGVKRRECSYKQPAAGAVLLSRIMLASSQHPESAVHACRSFDLHLDYAAHAHMLAGRPATGSACVETSVCSFLCSALQTRSRACSRDVRKLANTQPQTMQSALQSC
jgi:hypothetical protein